MLCKIIFYYRSGHGGQYHEDEETKSLLVKFRNTMRDGGWNRPQSLVKDDRMARTQRSNSRKLSVPRKNERKYFDLIDEVRAKL